MNNYTWSMLVLAAAFFIGYLVGNEYFMDLALGGVFGLAVFNVMSSVERK